MKTVFLGTPEFAAYSLKQLLDAGVEISAVVTMPDKPAGRGHKMLQSPVKQLAVERGLHLMQPVNLKDPAFVEELRSINADLFIVIAFRMLPEIVWSMPRLGTFNLHASLLPRYRGAAPINWAVINGDTETGVTTFFLKHEIDTGDIIAQERIEIAPEDNVGTVHDRLMELGAKLTLKTLRDIETGQLTTIQQDKLTGSISPTPAPKIFKGTCRIDWNRTATDVHNLVRGLSPYPAAWTTVEGLGDLKIFETQQLAAAGATIPGRINIDSTNGILTIDCSDAPLQIISLQPQGKRRMATADFLRGVRGQLTKCL